MVATFSSILAKGSGAYAQVPMQDVDAGAPVLELPRPIFERSDAGPPPPPVDDKPPPSEPRETAAPQAPAPMAPVPLRPSPVAPAQIAPAPLPQDALAAAPAEEGGKKKKKKKKERDRDDVPSMLEHKGRYGTFELKGRVLSRAEFDRSEIAGLDNMLQPVVRTVDSLDLSVPSARLSLRYQSPMEWLTAVAELDLAGNPDMKDGYVQMKASHWSLRFGQFRVPVSAQQGTSPWTLPFVRRGLIHDVLTERLDNGGRRPGIAVGWRDNSMGIRPHLIVGAFQGSELVREPTRLERNTDLLNGTKFPGQNVVVRGEIEILGMELGAYYENRIGSPALFTTHRYWTAGADLTFDHVFGNGGFRFWIDALAGSSWYELPTKTPDNEDPIFSVARALVAYRFGGVADESLYVEPFALAAALDPDADVKADLLYEGVLGVNVGYWKRARLTLQGEINKGQRNFPAGYFMGPPPDRIGVILQAGVAF